MNIKDYTAYFHDGGVIGFDHSGNSIQIFMESAEIDPEENKDNILLSQRNTICGKLNVYDVRKLTENNKPILKLEKKYDNGQIFEFKITNEGVILEVMWECRPFRNHTDIFTYEIQSSNIYWENIPNLVDPWRTEMGSQRPSA